jgi:alpha-beta hydrolase superfamily lysophospholipase
MRKFIIVGVIAALAVLVIAWNFGSLMVRAGPSDVPPAAAPAQDFTLAAADGVRIAATYWPGRAPAAPAVLLLHGNGTSRMAMANDAGWLSRLGYGVLAIDFRGHGRSQMETRSFGLRESRDAAAAFAWLKRRQQGAKIGVIGVSLGGAAALLGDDGPLPADALVLQAVYPDIRHAVGNRMAATAGAIPAWFIEPLLSFQSLPRWGVWPGRLSPVTAIRSYRGPVLVIGGGADRYTPPEETRSLFDAAPGPKELLLIGGLSHAQVSAVDTPAYAAHVGAFFARTIGTPCLCCPGRAARPRAWHRSTSRRSGHRR